MKKLLLLCFIAFSFNSNAQTVLFEENFEAYDDFIIDGIGDWITIDIDGSSTYAGGGGIEWLNRFQPQAFQVFNPIAAEVTNNAVAPDIRNFDARPGSLKYMGCWAAVMPGDGEGGAGPNNDWLVSPVIALGASQNEVKFWVKSLSTSYGLETYRVAVYVGSGTPSGPGDFTFISGANNLIAPFPNWEEKIFNLDNYANQSVRIGILCNSVDRYLFMVDDFSVTTETLSTEDFFANNLKIYPNPTKDIINLSTSTTLINTVSVTDLNGRIVKSFNLSGISQTELNVSDLTSGMYFVSVETDLGKGTTKIVKN
jgi:hypothetical protein